MEINTIDLTHTWKEVAPILATIIRDGTPEGRQGAQAELMRMAELADMWVKHQKINGLPKPDVIDSEFVLWHGLSADDISKLRDNPEFYPGGFENGGIGTDIIIGWKAQPVGTQTRVAALDAVAELDKEQRND